MKNDWVVYRHGNTKEDLRDDHVPGPGSNYDLYEVRISKPNLWDRINGKSHHLVFYDPKDAIPIVNREANVSITSYENGSIFVHATDDRIAGVATELAKNYFAGKEVSRQ